MRGWLYLTPAALVTALSWQSPAAAQASAAAPPPIATPPAPATQAQKPAAAADLISFDQYRAFRLRLIANRRAALEKRLAETDLTPLSRARLERIKGYYDFYAAMPASERDRRFRARFEEIDADHDGTISEAERAAWRDKERARYRQLAARRAAAAQQEK
ncbi:MAG TPA: hypothetical protein VGR91_19595 [Stellaceae bacterium]|nr:hypothetical protein [Stellaceae bacterium]